MFTGVVIFATMGLLICLYGMYVEHKVTKNQHYKAICDLSDMVSCTKTFLSPWGKTFGISNLFWGLLFYTAMIILGLLQKEKLACIAACAGMIATIYFAYILYTKVKTFCLLCISSYMVNIALYILACYNK